MEGAQVTMRDDLDPARGVIHVVALSVLFWLSVVALVWWLR